MRVYQLNTFCGVKSTGRIALEIAKLASSQGIECRIGYGVPGIPEEALPYADRIGTGFERKLHGAIRKLADKEGYGSIIGTRKWIERLEDFKPDVLHLHNIHGCYLYFPLLFREIQKLNIPVIWTLHDCWPFTGHCAFYDYSGCTQFETLCKHCPQKHSYPECIGISCAKSNYRSKRKWIESIPSLTFAAPCQWMAHQVKRSNLRNRTVQVIPNGINLKVFHTSENANRLRMKYGFGEKKIILSVASEWDHRKGLSELIDCRKKLDDRYVFVLIGLSREQIDTLPEGMLGLTHTADTDELIAWYTTADCLANPTIEDNLPMVNLEALACGTPVAVYDTGGCSDEVNPDCGILIAQHDVDALANAVRCLSDAKPSLSNACIDQARKFEVGKAMQAYVDLYREVTR